MNYGYNDTPYQPHSDALHIMLWFEIQVHSMADCNTHTTIQHYTRIYRIFINANNQLYHKI